MVKTGRSHVARLILLGCALALGSGSFGSSVAGAAPLEGLTGPVREATGAVEDVVNGVAPTVQEVTEAAPPPIAEVTEHVTPPIAEATQAVVPPAKEAVETVTRTTQEVAAKVPSPAVTTPPKLPAITAPDPAGGRKTVTHDVEGALGAVTGAAHADRSPASEGPAETSAAEDRSARGAFVPSEVAGADATATAKATVDDGGGDGLRDDEFEAPSSDGSIRAPLPKWMAYVWPAIALTGRELAGLLSGLQRAAVRLLPTAAAGGPSADHGVAGVRASDGARSAGSGSSSSPFAPIPAAIGGFTSHVPGEALAYLAMVGILVAAVFAAVKFEIARRDRGSG